MFEWLSFTANSILCFTYFSSILFKQYSFFGWGGYNTMKVIATDETMASELNY